MGWRKCIRCGKDYGPGDGILPDVPRDQDWNFNDGRCYGCYLEFCYEMYGGMMEPTFRVNGLIDGESEGDIP